MWNEIGCHRISVRNSRIAIPLLDLLNECVSTYILPLSVKLLLVATQFHRKNEKEKKVNNIFHSHHHKYIDTFSIKFNYPRQNICVRDVTGERRKAKGDFFALFISKAASIYLFEYLTRSSNKLSQLANQTFLLKYEAHYFYWDVFFFSSCDLQGTGMLFYYGFYYCSTFFISRFANERMPLKTCRNFGARKNSRMKNSYIYLVKFLYVS